MDASCIIQDGCGSSSDTPAISSSSPPMAFQNLIAIWKEKHNSNLKLFNVLFIVIVFNVCIMQCQHLFPCIKLALTRGTELGSMAKDCFDV